MKYGLALLLLIVTVATSGQDTIVVPEQQPVQIPALPTVHLELKDLVDILTEYAIVEETSAFFCGHFYGLTDFDSRAIHICGNYDQTAKRKTVIHESLHIIYYKHGIFTGGPYEAVIDKMAQEISVKLYGFPAPIEN